MTRNYTVVLKEELTGGHSVTVPALPGCVTDGDTLAHAVDMIRDAIEGYLEVMVENGKQPPVDKLRFWVSIKGAKVVRVRRVRVTLPEAAAVPV
jgi:predicted RNase H-like HicB family nuclease